MYKEFESREINLLGEANAISRFRISELVIGGGTRRRKSCDQIWEMDAIRKQASRLREQVARQQQVKMKIFKLYLPPLFRSRFLDCPFVFIWFCWFLVNQMTKGATFFIFGSISLWLNEQWIRCEIGIVSVFCIIWYLVWWCLDLKLLMIFFLLSWFYRY